MLGLCVCVCVCVCLWSGQISPMERLFVLKMLSAGNEGKKFLWGLA